MNFDPSRGWLFVIEDNLDIWTILKSILPRVLPDVKVVHALDQITALTYQRECAVQQNEPPRLILQNLYLPDRTDGLDLLKHFKQPHSPYREVPIMVMSSSTDRNDINEVHRLGASFFLTKPVRIDEWSKSLHGLRHYWWRGDSF